MNFIRMLAVAMTALALAGCASSYGTSGFTGGYDEKELEGGIWRVSFGGNGYTTPETTQTYWLYHCAELAIAKGFDGFEILSPIKLTSNIVPNDPDEPRLIEASFVYVPMYMDSSPKPSLTADIRMIKKPFTETPPSIFDAKKLKDELTPYVTGKKCDMGNVCPHVHRYLYPIGPTDKPV
ncbi:MAG: hypothetical protein P4L72_07925 [Parvibaculum sp.]|uniref:CC0125/CC1285 family lipoprotein n=1 Tax=Parvibaculum sp. TaxID=2024848 RepID=UPI0028435EC0|nr:hypothetical protein [Parvibaculum sp.]MDR3499139.1 hypothetical protein [Parvibaculum sp.]